MEMDTKPPFGTDAALSPKQLVLAGLCGCTAMDIASLLGKYKQPLKTLEVDAEADMTQGAQPSVFKEIRLVFKLTGEIETERALEAARLSQTQFCGVSAMLSKSSSILYTVILNGHAVGSGQAAF